MNKAIYILLLLSLILTFNSIEGKNQRTTKPACFKAPYFVFDEERKQYYRQDWCYFGKEPIYFDFIPVPENGERS